MNALNVVTLSEAKLFLRLDADYNYDDTLIESLITASVQEVELMTCQILYQRIITVKTNKKGTYRIFDYPLLSIESLTNTDLDAVDYEEDQSEWFTDVLSYERGYQTLVYVAGYGWDYEGGTETPAAIQTALKEMITYLYENRDNPKTHYPAIIDILLQPYKRVTLF